MILVLNHVLTLPEVELAERAQVHLHLTGAS